MLRSIFRVQNENISGQKTPPSIFNLNPSLVIAGLAVIILAAGIIFGFALTRITVTLVDSGREAIIKTRAGDVKKLLEEQNVILGPEDRVIPETTEKLKKGMRVVIKRANRITLLADQETLEFYSSADTVGDVLKEKQLALNEDDIVSPALEEEVNGPTEIKVVRVRTENEVVKAAVPYNTRRVPDSEMAKGISRTAVKGKEGEELQQWRVTYYDNQEVSRHLIDRKTIAKPVDRVLYVGTGQTISRGGELIRFREAMEVIATAYTYTGRNTASGTYPEYGVVAVDPRVIPIGTRMYIEGYGYATALDKGSAIIGNRIDVFLESEKEASRWGVRRVKIYLLP
jgi:uncharacterized protein YabE (DUF348 family)